MNAGVFSSVCTRLGLMASLKQKGQCAGDFEVGDSNRFVIVGIGNNDFIDALFHVFQVGCQAEDGHHFRGHGDVEAAFAGNAVRFAAKTEHDAAQRPFVQVHDPPPGNAPGIDVQLIAVVDVVVDDRRQEIVGGGDGMNVTGKMQVDVFHRHDLGIAAACRSALDAETGSEGRLAKRDDDFFAELAQSIPDTYSIGGFSFAGRSRIDGRDQNHFAIGTVFDLFPDIQGYFGLIFSVKLKIIF